MEKEKLLETVRNSGIGGTEFVEFIQYYARCREFLHQRCLDEGCPDKDKSMIGKLEIWLEDEGLSYFLRTLEQIPADMTDKVKDFARLYLFLLENSENNVEKLIDHMFYIPERFASDFAVAQVELFGRIGDSADGHARIETEEYSFNGNLEGGSLFFVLVA